MPPLLALTDIHFTLGGRPLLEGADLAVSPGERLCLVGRNGSGKSTLLRIATGELQAEGRVFLQPGTSIGLLPQEPDLSAYATVMEYAAEDAAPYRAAALLDRLGLDPQADPRTLSGGQARRAALARALAPDPELLLLDEPTNHLDLPAIEWLEETLAASRAALVLISHDRRLLGRLARGVVWLDRGRTKRLDARFDAFEAWRDATLEEEARDLHKLDRQIAREEDWMRYGVTARRKRNVRRVAELADLRRQKREHVGPAGVARLAAGEAAAAGSKIIEAKRLCVALGGRVLVRDLSLIIRRGDRVGIVGPNGAGKTTLLRLLTGTLPPDSGSVRLGTNLVLGTMDQRRDTLSPETTLSDALTGGGGDQVVVGTERRHVVGVLKDYLFRPEQARTPLGRLSGGERGRLLLALAMTGAANLLVLDEPTNDLDFETLDLLQERLGEYAGTVLLVSHDRDFLDRVATSVVAAAGDGAWLDYAGGYSDMLAQRREAEPAAAAPATASRKAPTLRPAASRFSFTDRHALQALPGRIAALQAEAARWRSALAAPGLFERDPQRFAAGAAALAAAEAGIAQAEEQWLALEVRREESEAG